MKILKFGGTSVGNSQNIKKVYQVVKQANSNDLIVVVSAMSGVTNLLESAVASAAAGSRDFEASLKKLEDHHLVTIRDLFAVSEHSKLIGYFKRELNKLETLLEGAFMIGESTPRLKDKVLSYGEQFSSYLIQQYFACNDLDSWLGDSRALIKTNENFGKAQANVELTHNLIREAVKDHKGKVGVLQGFVASSENGHTTTLGRGGSDYTAAIVAAATNAEILEIWTDVSGMYTADPRMVKQAFAIPHISYEEAMELSHFGAKVLYPPSIQPVLEKAIPIVIKNTFDPEAPGTKIAKRAEATKRAVRGISRIGDISLLSLEGPGLIGIPGTSQRFFNVLSSGNINVVMITQASSEHSICVGIADEDAEKAIAMLRQEFEREIASHKVYPPLTERELSIIALVGDQMKSYQGLSGRMFSALGKNNVNIRAIAQGASERNISAVIANKDVKKALNTLHEEFFEDRIKQLNLFVMGAGNVGKRFLEQVRSQKAFLREQLKINIRVTGLANSRTMVFNDQGLELDQWEKDLPKGEKASLEGFYNKVLDLNLRNSVFVDITANEKVAFTYADYLSKSVAVVTCNKIAASADYAHYRKLKELSKHYNTPFLFETNVGAGLPVLDTLKHLVISGDQVNRIEAVLSGSLNFIFNNYNQKTSFNEVVQRAMDEGYTEPDPRIDLSGVDVMRKILILARESGYELDLEQITRNDFLPEGALDTASPEEFLKVLSENEPHFESLLNKAESKGCKLKYVASFNQGKASVGLREIPDDHPFYHLEGKDNIVLFYTNRYPDQPLNIKGAGAGAEVTASGIFADIIRTVNQ
ncbi:bifunctional aspartate kinase/homoserine dehydrogenase I [Robertkochia sediminum]|uniref:bifunctional aspartate kinase/homoserine dehydrogenase I n=1 Tax=Robertkochia sediminum TaxID=2785326 RepID=UPI00193477E0|nr:bifunctional aspartate kinase/homoserine dehydrogenase I [Robertkochia sediminum]MBL7474127.1 bifunctional aspartate kinase/homoserine dehydrogenase I [Robertkochia sediminum]